MFVMCDDVAGMHGLLKPNSRDRTPPGNWRNECLQTTTGRYSGSMKKERVVEPLQYSGTDGRKLGRAIWTLRASLWKLRQLKPRSWHYGFRGFSVTLTLRVKRCPEL